MHVRDTMEIEKPDGSRMARVHNALISSLRERWKVDVDDGVEADGRKVVAIDEMTHAGTCAFLLASACERARGGSMWRRLGPGLLASLVLSTSLVLVAGPATGLGTADNPPGLNLPAPSPMLDMRGSGTPFVPADLTTGCFVLRDTVPGVEECEGRVTHAALNKDLGLIGPSTGNATGPTTPRGSVGDNFAKAVAGAIAETRHQWRGPPGRAGRPLRRGEGRRS